MNLVIMSIDHTLSLIYLMKHPKFHQLNQLVNQHAFHQTPIDYDKLRPYFGWVNCDIVKQTTDQTTQWGVALDSFLMKRHLKSWNPD